MIFSSFFKKTLLISAIGHIAVFSIFSFSFGYRLPKVTYPQIVFWGALLRGSDLTPSSGIEMALRKSQNFSSSNKAVFIKRPRTTVLDRTNREWYLGPNHYFPAIAGSPALAGEKPTLTLPLNPDKIIFKEKTGSIALAQNKTRPAIMLYPHLPYHFLLYFKDRQLVHIELMFNIISSNGANSIVIKRKTSSGNLEADLLSMRYISHYLFLQQASFTPDKWQSVKIELSEAITYATPGK